MENDNKQELLETMVANSDVVAAICNAQEDYKKYVYKTFVKSELENFASDRKLIFKDFNIFSSVRGVERGFCFHREEWKFSAIYIWTKKNGEWDFYWGISNYQGGPLKVEKRKVSWLESQPDDEWPYGSERLGKYKDWHMETISEMVKGNYTKYIIGLVDKALEEIDKDKLPML